MGNALEFRYPVRVTIGKTNMEGNVYWARYFDWLGEAREEFLLSLLPTPAIMQMFGPGAQMVLITHETTIQHHRPTFFGDKIVLVVTFTEVGHTKATMLVKFVRAEDSGETLVAEGKQVLVVGNAEGKPIEIPPALKEMVLNYVSD